MYDADGELSGVARVFADAVEGADQALRTACHLLPQVAAGDMKPADWCSRVGQIGPLLAKLDQIVLTIIHRYRVQALLADLRHDSGGDPEETVERINGLLYQIHFKLAACETPAREAHNQAARLGLNEVDDPGAEEALRDEAEAAAGGPDPDLGVDLDDEE